MSKLPRSAQYYIGGMMLAGIACMVWVFLPLPKALSSPVLLVFVCLLATTLQIFKIDGTTARSSYNLSWLVFGATFAGFGGQAMLLVIIVAHLGEWLWHRYSWHIQSFNIAAFTVAGTAAVIVDLSRTALPQMPSNTRDVVAILFAMLVFTLVNHLLVGLVIKLAQGQSLSQSGVFTLATLTIDFGLLCLGASAALIVQVSPAAVILLLVVAYLVQSALRVPALERKSEQDSKTGLYNAQHFEEALVRELLRAQKLNRPLTVVMADLDKMREINNSYGHLAGDFVLKKVAQILQALTQDGDVVARYGGEEFGILLPDTTLEEAHLKIDAMRRAIESAEFIAPTNGALIKTTMSFGIADYAGGQQTTKELLHNADIAVYAAKDGGRNRVELYGPALDSIPIQPNWTELDGETQSGRSHETAAEAMLTDASAHSSFRASNNPVDSNAVHRIAPDGSVIAAEPSPNAPPANLDLKIQWYIGTLVISAGGLTMWSAYTLPPMPIDWIGITAFVLLAIALELVATQIYSRDTSVSTAVATTIGAIIVFGAVGAILICFAIAIVNQLRMRKPINRLLFNLSNHLIGCALSLLLIQLDPAPLLEWPILKQFVFAILASIVIYLSSTLLLTGVLSLSTGQKFMAIWQERFKWLGLHYVAMGTVAFLLVYSYNAIGALSVIIMVVPLIMLHFSQHQYIEATKSMVEQLNEKNRVLSMRNQEVQTLNDELLLALASTIDLRDPFVVEHSRHVARYAALVAEELGLSPARIHLVYQAGLIHDIGKLAIPEAILFKPGRLTDDEYEVIKEHVTVGADLLDDFESLQRVGRFVRHHHERFDGQGYPDRLQGENIPLEARILALADAVEAMASDRPYRSGSSVTTILKEVQREAGGQFDPIVVDAFVKVVTKQGAATIVNSARSVELPELKSNAALREDFASWAAPTLPASSTPTNTIMPVKRVQP